MGIGEWSALTAALLWTISSILWGQLRLSAMSINLAKNIVASLILIVQLVLVAAWFQTPLLNASPASMGWLAASGLIGIVAGDTLFFRSIQILGPRRALMVATTAPLFAAVLGWLLLNEYLSVLAFSGIILTVAGVVVVVMDRNASRESPGLLPGKNSAGILCGLAGAACQAVGGALAKKGMVDCNPDEATLIRILVSAACISLFLLFQKRLLSVSREFLKPEVLKILIPAAALGTWLGIWLSQIAYKHTEIAIATTLHSTCPLFAIPVVRFYYKIPISPRAILGTVAACVGIFLIVN